MMMAMMYKYSTNYHDFDENNSSISNDEDRDD